MNRGGLRKRLLFSHLGVAISSLLAIMLLVNLVTTYSFGRYTKNQEQTEANRLLDDLESSYNDATDNWSKDTLLRISHQAMLRDYIVRIYDSRQKLLWDTNVMGMPMHSIESTDGEIEVSTNTNTIQKEMMKEGRRIGTLEIQGIETAFESQNQQFLRMVNLLLWVALVIVIIGVYLFSVFIANGISRPLVRIKEIAAQMREGNLSSRVTLVNQNTEIEEVGLALNHLADTLVQEDNLRKNLTADIAHELRTPLATIQSHIEAFQDGIWEATPEKLQICHDQVIRLVQLIHDLENLTAVENPMLQLRNEKVCLNEVIHDVINTGFGQHSVKPISLEVHEDNPVYMTGDYKRLVQVFSNILNNAYKYTDEGSIHVYVSEERDRTRVTITDTGIGISADELPLILERFYRSEKSRNRNTGGSGIGLAIVKAIVEAHGGKITIQSMINQGSEFNVFFPNDSSYLKRF